ncbi:MAG: class II glutamine amidotransferase [Candidatus Aenigmarchaeota archaeon]|nr:class II glutamine amidotransferase [Candidatus Aenigmarchaeota archaeon]
MCGIIGIYNFTGENIVKTAAIGLLGVQNRGHEGAGLAFFDDHAFRSFKEFGYAHELFKDKELYNGNINLKDVVGATRYSTQGGTDKNNLQPHTVRNIVLVHNGNLINTHELRPRYDKRFGGEYDLQGTTDSELLAAIFADSTDLIEGAEKCAREALGGYSIIVMNDRGEMLLAKDPQGFWPLVYGKHNGTFYAASETSTLQTWGFRNAEIHHIQQGEYVFLDSKAPLDAEQIKTNRVGVVRESTPCYFNDIYFGRPSSVNGSKSNHFIRKELGRIHARRDREEGIRADAVVPIMHSGLSYAVGYAQESGYPLDTLLDINHSIGRIYISPDGKGEDSYLGLTLTRDELTRIKHVPMEPELGGKRIVLTDDSIIRSVACNALVEELFNAGVAEIHLRIGSPPIRYPCAYGQDFSTRRELAAASAEKEIGSGEQGLIEEYLANALHVTSLRYSTIEDLKKTAGRGICTACLDGSYKPELPDTAQFRNALAL